MRTPLRRSLRAAALILAGAAGLSATAPGAPADPADPIPLRARHQAASNTIRIGHTATVTGEVTAQLIAAVLRRRLGYRVEPVLADVAFLYSALGARRIDVFAGAWTPDAHRAFLARLAGQAEPLGTLSHRARLGWLVPAGGGPPGSIAELAEPAVRRSFGGRIHAGEAGSGVMRLSRRALARYRLTGWRLESSSRAAATLALKRAHARGEPVIATGRRPHWILDALPLAFLADPKDAFGGPQRIRILGRRGFTGDHPWAAQVLGRLSLPPARLQALVSRAHARGTDAAVRAFLARRTARVDYWVSARIAE